MTEDGCVGGTRRWSAIPREDGSYEAHKLWPSIDRKLMIQITCVASNCFTLISPLCQYWLKMPDIVFCICICIYIWWYFPTDLGTSRRAIHNQRTSNLSCPSELFACLSTYSDTHTIHDNEKELWEVFGKMISVLAVLHFSFCKVRTMQIFHKIDSFPFLMPNCWHAVYYDLVEHRKSPGHSLCPLCVSTSSVVSLEERQAGKKKNKWLQNFVSYSYDDYH